MTQPSVSWIKQINLIAQSLEIPQWGKTFSLDWDALSRKISAAFSLADVEIRKVGSEWLSSEEILSGLGSKPSIQPIELFPIESQCFLAISFEDKKKLISLFLGNGDKKKAITDSRIEDAFYYFAVLSTLQKVDELTIFEGCSLRMGEHAAIPKENSFCIDVAIHKGHESIFLRVICPENFNNSFKAFYLQRKEPIKPSTSLQLPLSCVVGHTDLTLSEWQKMEIGDLLLLDSCSYNPTTGKGNLDIYVYGKKLIHARIKHNGLKVVEFSDFFEGDNMIDDDDFTEDESNFEFDEELENSEEMDEELESDEEAEKVEHAEKELSSLSKISLNVHVEVAKFTMPLEKLLQLSVGNIIETGVHPEQGVSLNVNGKTIAKGELIRIGDILGVKILEMGEP